jgi:hypothetical protein
VWLSCSFFFCFPFLVTPSIPPTPLRLAYPLAMEESRCEGTPPRVTRRGTSQGENPPPQDFDRGWSSLRGKKSTAGVFMGPLPPLHRLPDLSLIPAPQCLTFLRLLYPLLS